MGYQGVSILDRYVLEPSSGDGAFLTEIVNRYIDVCEKQKKSSKEIIKRLEKYIYGIELDEAEYQKSINRLNCLVLGRINDEVELNWNIFNENTLDIYPKYLGFFDYIVAILRNLIKKN